MNDALKQWNEAESEAALGAMLACCGARRWASAMIARRPIATAADLHDLADHIWASMRERDWMEAFACHPRIGERSSSHSNSQSTIWSNQEQASIQTAADATLAALAEGNARYEEEFGFTYIICATSKSSDEMLAILNRRLAYDRETELQEAAEQQRHIMHVRLGKWLEE
jgi:2-oxo-4-hydroxy-4-carboxy-5-ureidoimidazoline decarboxylase